MKILICFLLGHKPWIPPNMEPGTVWKLMEVDVGGEKRIIQLCERCGLLYGGMGGRVA